MSARDVLRSYGRSYVASRTASAAAAGAAAGAKRKSDPSDHPATKAAKLKHDMGRLQRHADLIHRQLEEKKLELEEVERGARKVEVKEPVPIFYGSVVAAEMRVVDDNGEEIWGNDEEVVIDPGSAWHWGSPHASGSPVYLYNRDNCEDASQTTTYVYRNVELLRTDPVPVRVTQGISELP